MTNEIKHTELPFKLVYSATSILPGILIKADNIAEAPIGLIPYALNATDKQKRYTQANAEFIVRACNNHYKLLAALKEMRADKGACLAEIAAKADKAIKSAEGK